MSVEIKKILKGYKNKGNLGQSKQVSNSLKIQLTSQCTCTQKYSGMRKLNSITQIYTFY